MGFLNLSVYHHRSGLAFDPGKVLTRAKEAFPEAEFLPGNQSELEVQNAEATLADRLRSEGPAGPASKIIASLRRKAQSYGPSYSFRIPLANGHSVQGLLRSVGVQFTFDRSMPADLRQRILQFLTRLGLGTLEEGTEDQPVQVLLDLPGPSSYMRDAPGVPWQEVYSGPAMTAEAD